jgi:hybrid cluster-associated redox disulfide protein
MRYIIKKDSLISEIVKKSPRAIELLKEYGLSCATCIFSQFENIEAGAKLHGMTDKEIERMVNEINDVLKEEKV